MVKHARSNQAGYARHIGRVGALAVALGIGTAVANGNGIAYADSTENDPNSSQGSENESGQAPSPNPEPPGPEPGPPAPSTDPTPGSSGPAGVKVNDPPKTTVSAQTTKITADEQEATRTDVEEEDVEEEEEQESEQENEQRRGGPAPGTGATGTTKPVGTTVPVDHDPKAPSGSPVQRVLADPPQPFSPVRQNRARVAEFQDRQTFSRSRSATVDPPANTVQPLARARTAAVVAGPTQPTALTAPVTARSVVSDVLRWFGLAPLAVDSPVPARPVPPVVEALWSFVRRLEYTFFNDRPTATHTVDPQNLHTGVITGKIVGDDGDGDTLTYTVTDRPDHGTVTVDGQGNFVYTPSDDFAETGGSDSFTVTVSDRIGNPPHVHGLLGLFGLDRPTTETVQLSVVPVVNEAPVVVGSGYVTDSVDLETGVVRGHVTFRDPDGDDLTYSLDAAPDPTVGTLDFDLDTGEYVFTPTPQARLDAYNQLPDLQFATFNVTAGDGRETATTTVLAPIDATDAVAIPLGDGLDFFTPPVVRKDGAAFVTTTRYDPALPGYRTTVVIISPTKTTTTTIELDGEVAGFVFADDGTAYQVATNRSNSTTTVVVIDPLTNTATAYDLEGRSFGGIFVGADGRAYQTSSTRQPGEIVGETKVAIFDSAGGQPTIVTVNGSPSENIRETISFAPNGDVYVTTAVSDGFGFTTEISKINPDGTTTPVASLDGLREGPLVFHGGATYQTTQVGNQVVVTNIATRTVLMTADGQVAGPVLFSPNGTAFLRTLVDNPDAVETDTAYTIRLAVVAPGDPATTTVVYHGFQSAPLLGPDGTVYISVQTTDPETGRAETMLAQYHPDGSRTEQTLLGEDGGVYFAPDGDVYRAVVSQFADVSPVTFVTRIRPAGQESSVSGTPGRINGITFAPDGMGFVTATQESDSGPITGVSIFEEAGREISLTFVAGSATGPVVLGSDGTAYQTIRTTDPNTGAATSVVYVISPTFDTTTIPFAGEAWGATEATSTGIIYQATQVTGPRNETTEATVWIMKRSATDVNSDTAPVAVAEPTVGTPDPVTGAVTGLVNVVDTDGDRLYYTLVSEPSGGTVVFDSATGTYTYTPDQAERYFSPDEDRFAVAVSDYVNVGFGIDPILVTVHVPVLPAEIVVVGDPVEVGDAPDIVEVSPDGRRAYVLSNENVTVLDLTTDAPTVISTVGVPFARDVVLSTDSSRAYLATTSGVTVVDNSAALPSVIDEIEIDGGAISLAIGDDGRLYVASPSAGRVLVYDVTDDANLPLGHVLTVDTPGEMVMSPDGATLYVEGYDRAREVPVVYVYETRRGVVAATIDLDTSVMEMAVATDSDTLYVLKSDGEVLRFDTSTGTPAPAGSRFIANNVAPGMALSPDGSMIYVPLQNGDVYVLSADGLHGIGVVEAVSEAPWDVAVSPDGSHAYVVDQIDSTLVVLEFRTPPPEEPEIPPVV